MKNKNLLFIILFAVSLAVPVYGRLLDRGISLSGVSAAREEVVPNIQDIQDGTYQKYLNDTWEDSFPGRKLLLKTRNQLLYSCLDVSPNENVVIGRNKCLFEPMYILYETQVYPPSSDEYFDELANKLTQFRELLDRNGKELYLFITPSKAHYMKEDIPKLMMYADQEQYHDTTNYLKFIETLDKSGVHYFDSIKYIDEHKDSGMLKAPLFYNSGIHWSHSWGRTCAAKFLDMMNAESRYDLSSVSVSEEFSDEPIEPDTDLYSSMNLLFDAEETWYDAPVTVEHEGSDKPSVFIRGGSFLGQSISALVRADVFGSDVHFENNYWFLDKYTAAGTLSGFTTYDELPLDFLVGKSDIVILEVNDAVIANMSFGFVDYMLQHPEYADDDYVAEM